MEIIIILCLIVLNGVLSMSEMALVSARKTKLEAEIKKGSKSALTALRLANKPNTFLSTIQIGITLIGILTGLFSGEAFSGDLAEIIRKVPLIAPYAMPLSKFIIVIIITYLTLVLGELVPKRIGMSRAEKISKFVANPMNRISRIATPFVWILSKSTNLIVKLLGIKTDTISTITEEEIKAIVKEGYNIGEVQEMEQDIVERVFNLGDRDISSIMTHRSELVCLDVDDSFEMIRKKIKQNLHSVYPVISKNIDHIIGIVNLKDLFDKADSDRFSIHKLIHSPQYLPENQSVYIALDRFKKAHVKYGIVIDEFGSVQGIVTLKDILEALIGLNIDENGIQEIINQEDGSWMVNGQCSFYDFLDYFNLKDLYPKYDYNTLSGLILEILEHIPETGEKLLWNNFEFEITEMQGVRIDKVRVREKSQEKMG